MRRTAARDPVMKYALFVVALVFLLGVTLYAKDDPAPARLTVQFVPVEKDVKLEVVDWAALVGR